MTLSAFAGVAATVFAVLLGTLAPRAAAQQAEPNPFDEKAALEYSQSAIGRTVGSHVFRDRSVREIDLTDLRGKPLVVNMIYTSCYNTCPVILESLYDGVKVAQDALGEDSFSVVTIGFDARNDTPQRMRDFARSRGVDLPNWYFLSGKKEIIERLSKTLGFIYFPSPKGFDHLAQTSVLKSDGTIYRHVYGSNFGPQALAEPLKELVFGIESAQSLTQAIINRVRLFCTIYDPRAERYRFDYSIFIGGIIGLLILSSMGFVIARNVWRLWRASRAA
ncbi:MAG TPA: SCO family protein [Rhizobiales bacterium]|nr:hypothetical protein BMS3Bbin10_02794 [bacterium BMS3Bbin10]HDO51782.1 SCO family protein [Hyphomicrobiales bacterium]